VEIDTTMMQICSNCWWRCSVDPLFSHDMARGFSQLLIFVTFVRSSDIYRNDLSFFSDRPVCVKPVFLHWLQQTSQVCFPSRLCFNGHLAVCSPLVAWFLVNAGWSLKCGNRTKETRLMPAEVWHQTIWMQVC
jgi:hypothetical protein